MRSVRALLLAGAMLVAGLGLTGCKSEADQELISSVQASIEAKMAEPFKARAVEVEGLSLKHQQAERYQGELQVREQGVSKSYAVEVQFDGTYFIWKIPGWEESEQL